MEAEFQFGPARKQGDHKARTECGSTQGETIFQKIFSQFKVSISIHQYPIYPFYSKHSKILVAKSTINSLYGEAENTVDQKQSKTHDYSKSKYQTTSHTCYLHLVNQM